MMHTQNRKGLLIIFLTLTFLFEGCSLKKKKQDKSNKNSMSRDREESDEDLLSDLDTSGETENIEDISIENSMVPLTGDIGEYTVQSPQETLMLIAFKLYGDYKKWRSIAQLNEGNLGSNYSVSVGQRLKYKMPSQNFNWRPEGTPYLIQAGDSLSSISHNVYGNYKYWKRIWHNNKPMIQNPNLIFAGFTLYYPDRTDDMVEGPALERKNYYSNSSNSMNSMDSMENEVPSYNNQNGSQTRNIASEANSFQENNGDMPETSPTPSSMQDQGMGDSGLDEELSDLDSADLDF